MKSGAPKKTKQQVCRDRSLGLMHSITWPGRDVYGLDDDLKHILGGSKMKFLVYCTAEVPREVGSSACLRGP